MRKILCFVTLVYLVANFTPGYTLICYQCEDILGQGLHCESNVKSVLQPNCTEGFDCLKYIWRANTTRAVHRGCAPATKCEELTASGTDLEYCGTCNSHLCNVAHAQHVPLITWLFATVFIVTFVELYQYC